MTIRPQERNANRHTERGMQALERSIAADGWIGAVTVAADGETFDGSARIETTAANGMLDDAIIVETDGSKPIIVKRTDIPTATDPRAVRLGLAANRVAQLNLEWEPGVLAEIAQDIDIGALWTPEEWREAAMPDALPEPGAGGDEFDTTPDDGPTRAQSGDLWLIDGGRHRLMVGDCTDPDTVARLMGGERADIGIFDPPYGMRLDTNNKRGVGGLYNGAGEPNRKNYEPVMGDDEDYDPNPVMTLFPAKEQFWFGADYYAEKIPNKNSGSWLVWDKRAGIEYVDFTLSEFELVWSKERHARKLLRIKWFGIHGMEHQDTSERVHPTQKPLELIMTLLETHSDRNALAVDTYLGSGTTLIAAHRTGRRCYGCEIEPRYADVILRRCEAEGLTVERVETPHKAETTP